MSDFIDSYRVVTFVPAETAQDFIDKVSPAIPSFLGPYDKVIWWSQPGTEQFRPLKGSHPEQGKQGKTEWVASVRVEFSLPKDEAVLRDMIENNIKPHHPWDEPLILAFEAKIACA